MTKIKNWQINVSIVLIVLGFCLKLYDLLLSALFIDDLGISLGVIIGFLIGIYFTILIPIKVMVEYKRGYNGTEKTK